MANLQHHVNVRVNRQRVVRRRDFLKLAPALGAAGMIGWHDYVSLSAAELRKRGMSCILLWMQGGPSQMETFSPKPGHKNGGETKAIATNVSGVQFADNLPHLAKVADQAGPQHVGLTLKPHPFERLLERIPVSQRHRSAIRLHKLSIV